MGYRGHADWRDMSEYVVHFTRDLQSGSAYNSQMSILGSRKIEARTRFGAARRLDALEDSQRCACFSEVPLDRLNRLVERRSRYGIGFLQETLMAAGGGRVWYIDKYSGLQASFDQLMNQYARSPLDVNSPFWHLTPFIDFPGTYGTSEYRFEWEREWRVPGGLSFSPSQVAFLFIPEEYHSQARAFFSEAEKANTGPNYPCPFLDPLWPDERIQAALSSI